MSVFDRITHVRLTPYFLYYSACLVVIQLLANYFIFFDLLNIYIIVFLILFFVYHSRIFTKLSLIHAERRVNERLYLHDESVVDYFLSNQSNLNLKIQLIDDIPEQCQIFNMQLDCVLPSQTTKNIQFKFIANQRGVYKFCDLHLIIQEKFSALAFHKIIKSETVVAVYPSVPQMKYFELISFSNRKYVMGFKKIRKIGQSREFEQIRDYVQGDDPRQINWHATARQHKIMINQTADEISQNIYCLIDKGKSMQMPFNGLSLLDYSINSALVLSNLILKSYDKAGLITFSKSIDYFLPAERPKTQLIKILDVLYKQESDFCEPNYEELNLRIRTSIHQRSLLFLFSNVLSFASLQRQLKFLKLIAKKHLLIVIYFQNSVLETLKNKKEETLEDIYFKTICDELLYEKVFMKNILMQNGIQSILCQPEELSISVLNKYLEIKSRHIL